MGDVPLLAQSFLREFAKENSKPVNEFTPDALEALMNYHWPGNVRELRTAMEHAVVLCRGEKIAARDLPPSVRGGAPAAANRSALLARNDLTVKEAEKQLIIRALKETRWQPHTGGQKNWHEPAHAAPQAAHITVSRIFEYAEFDLFAGVYSRAGVRGGSALCEAGGNRAGHCGAFNSI